MKKRAIIRTVVLSALILLVLFAMHLPWAYWVAYAPSLSDPLVYVYEPYNFFRHGSDSKSIAACLTVLALLLTPFCIKHRVCNRICSGLLLSAGVAILYDGIAYDFSWFTPLTWGIVAVLAVLGLWTLITSFKKPKAQNAEPAAPQT